jgi:ERCC4-type nuclease
MKQGLKTFLESKTQRDKILKTRNPYVIANILREAKEMEQNKFGFLTGLAAMAGWALSEQDCLVDAREHPDIIKTMQKLGFKVVTLENGDYHFNDIIVERKSDDFLDSAFSSRLFNQLCKMRATGKPCYLVVDKPFTSLLADALKRGVAESAVYGIIALCCKHGFPPVFMDDKECFAELMSALVRKTFDGKTRGIYSDIEPKRRDDDRSIYLLCGLPHVDEVLAKRLIEKFKTPHNVFVASAHELQQVKGIGKKYSQDIVNAIAGLESGD